MEWIDGKKLFEVWAGLTPDEVQGIALQLIAAIRAMHDADVCHHDLHAGNVMVKDGHVTVIDVHYTESARFSQLTSEPKSRLIADDCSAVARLIRNMLWNAKAVGLPAGLEGDLRSAGGLNEIENLVRRAFQETSRRQADDAFQLGEPAGYYAELDALDKVVILAACDLLLQQERFESFVSVTALCNLLNNTAPVTLEEVFSSIRLLRELGYLIGFEHDTPRYVMVSHTAFNAYLRSHRSQYAAERKKARVALARQDVDSDEEISQLLEIPRPIAEHILHELDVAGMIQLSRYNTGMHVIGVSERLQREVDGR